VARSRRAFTLIEVTLGLAIVVQMFAVMFLLVQTAVMSADEAGKNSRGSREVSGFFALMRQMCLELPARTQLRLESAGLGWGYDLILRPAPPGILPERYGGLRTLRFGLERDVGGTGKMLVMEEIFQRTNQPNRISVPETNRFVLMRDVVRLEWLPGNPNNREKMEEPGWEDPIKPAYLRMRLVRREGGRNLTHQGIFWIPMGYGPGGQPPVDGVTRVAGDAGQGTGPTNLVVPPNPPAGTPGAP